MSLTEEQLTRMETTEIPWFLAAAGYRKAHRKPNEGITDVPAIVDISRTIKIYINCYNVWKECLKTESLSHSIVADISFVDTYP